jgi:exodeoxyribonuclease VII small subunit
MSDTDKSMNFEKKLNDLEALVAKLETGDLSLEESLKAYEAGIALTSDCQSLLEKAQLRIEMATSEVSKSEPSSDKS